MTREDVTDYELVLTPPARRALTAKLPEPVAAAVIEFMTTALVRRPHRVGKPLRDDLAGVWSARRGTYRVLYRNPRRPTGSHRPSHRAPARRLPAVVATETSRLSRLVTGSGRDGEAVLAARPADPGLERAICRWRDRLDEVPSRARLAAWQESGFRLVAHTEVL